MPQPNNPYLAQVAQAAQAAGIDPTWAQATLLTENAPGNPSAVSSSGAQGLMQVMPSNAAGANLDNPEQNIQRGVAILAANLKAAGGNKSKASAMYFAGPNTALWGLKTHAYVQKVANNYNALDSQMNPSPPSEQSATPALDAMFAKSQAASQTAQQQAQVPTPALDAMMAKAQAAQSQQTKSVQAQGGLGANLKAGMEDVLITPGLALDRALNGTKVGTFLQNQHVLATPAQDQATYNQDHANLGTTLPDQAARFAGQTVIAAPVLATGEGIVGAGAEAAGAGLDAAGAPLAGNVARVAGRFVTGKSGAGIIGRGASLAAQGAAQGAGFNALTGRNPVQGAEIGAVANPLLGGVGRVIEGGASSLANSIRPAQQKAAAIVGNALANDGVTSADLQSIGRNGNSLLSVAGANINSLAQAIANKPGEARGIVDAAHDAVIDNLPSDLHGAIASGLNSEGDVHDLAAQITAQKNAAAAPKFEAAFANAKPNEEQAAKLQTLVNLPRGQQAVKTALQNLTDEAERNGQTFDPASLGVKIGDDGKVEISPDTPVLPFLHQVKRGLDDNIEKTRDPVTGKLPSTSEARNLGGIRDSFRDTLTNMFPEYGDALKAYSEPSEVVDAINFGRKLPNGDVELSSARIAKMTPEEKQGVQAGVARYFADKFNGPSSDNATIQRMLRDRNLQSRVKAAFPSQKAFNDFWTLLKDKGAQASAYGDVMRGPKTAKTLLAASHNWANTLLHAGYETAAGSPVRAGLMLGRNLLDHAKSEGDPALDAQIANLLTNPNKAAVTKQLQSALPGIASRSVGALSGAAGKAVRLYGVPSQVPQNALTGPQ